jgi:starch synthase
MEIIHVSAECYPVAKVGGLADVVGALPKYLDKMGHVAKVVMPAYKNKFVREHEWETTHEGNFQMGLSYYYRIQKEKTNLLGFDLYIVEIPGLLEEEHPYGYWNDTHRHLGFQIAVVDWMNAWQHSPDVVNCHDHHSGLIPFMMQCSYKYQKLKYIPTVFTIHNGQYQGWIGREQEYLIPHFDDWKRGLLIWKETINSMACAIKCANKVTTVSQSYLHELRTHSLGLESLFISEQNKSVGILNGIDSDVWNPETDTWIEMNYNSENVLAGKEQNKKVLCETFQLSDEKPLFVFIGRLVEDKGADLLAPAIYNSVMEHNGNVNFLVLGSGANEFEDALNGLKNSIPQNFNCYIGYNERLAHLIYAGADFLMMPSRVEPCGLNQMYALRYGTIPMVRSTGGLIDTVNDFGNYEGFGIRFDQASVWDINYSIGRAISLFNDKEKLNPIKKRIMTFDHSWDNAAAEYLSVYSSLQ